MDIVSCAFAKKVDVMAPLKSQRPKSITEKYNGTGRSSGVHLLSASLTLAQLLLSISRCAIFDIYKRQILSGNLMFYFRKKTAQNITREYIDARDTRVPKSNRVSLSNFISQKSPLSRNRTEREISKTGLWNASRAFLQIILEHTRIRARPLPERLYTHNPITDRFALFSLAIARASDAYIYCMHHV